MAGAAPIVADLRAESADLDALVADLPAQDAREIKRLLPAQAQGLPFGERGLDASGKQ